MKNVIKIALLLFVTIAVFSCDKEDDLEDLKDKTLGYNVFFEKVSAMDIKTNVEDNAIYIDYEWNTVDKTIKYLDSKEKELDFFILEFESEEDISQRIAAGEYKVSCDNSDNSWTKNCSGIRSCGKLIAKCLDEGGCATAYQLEMVYLPQTKNFYLLKE